MAGGLEYASLDRSPNALPGVHLLRKGAKAFSHSSVYGMRGSSASHRRCSSSNWAAALRCGPFSALVPLVGARPAEAEAGVAGRAAVGPAAVKPMARSAAACQHTWVGV